MYILITKPTLIWQQINAAKVIFVHLKCRSVKVIYLLQWNIWALKKQSLILCIPTLCFWSMIEQTEKIWNKFNVAQEYVKCYANKIQSSLSSTWRIISMLHRGRVCPCGCEGKGDISLWLGGKGVYIHTASMTHISCLSEHSLLRSHTRRKPLIEANPTTMTYVMLKAIQLTEAQCFSSVFLLCDSTSYFPTKQTFILFVWGCSDLCNRQLVLYQMPLFFKKTKKTKQNTLQQGKTHDKIHRPYMTLTFINCIV